MSTYELDDELVQAWIDGDGGLAPDLGRALRAQIPLPVPTKIGAVVRATYTGGYFSRWAPDEGSSAPWVDYSDGEHLPTEKLGRITAVLSEGVDL